jgi:signal transduction histidine kinase
MLAVSIPLLIILVVQYRSLVELERTLPIANKAWMKKYLATVNAQIEDFYRKNTEQSLCIPAGTFDRERLQRRPSDLATHFLNHPPKGAKRIFIGFTGEDLGRDYSMILFYNPDADQKFTRDPSSQHWHAAHSAGGYWLYHSMIKVPPKSSDMIVDERDPGNRIITKPILDQSSMVIGVVGMFVDEDYFKKEVIPHAIGRSLQQFFPYDYNDVIVTLYDESGNLTFATQPVEGKKYEVSEPLQFIFSGWRLKIMMRDRTEEQVAKRVFAINFSLSILMTGLLIGGIVMALRTASREMKLSQMKADFVSNVSHELRTPLASIRVFGEFLRLGRVKDLKKIREYGEYIENESRRLTQLINNILDFSKIESGRKIYKFEKSDIVEIIAEALKSFNVRLSQSSFNITYDIPDYPFPSVVADSESIAQAFLNLLDNAVKYSGTSKEIMIRVGMKDHYVTISVIDHGIGIPLEEQQKIFEKFYRVSTGLVHDVKGSGLGLSLVKHTMEAHQGMVTVESEPGFGSTFTIYLSAGNDLGSAAHIKDTESIDENSISMVMKN